MNPQFRILQERATAQEVALQSCSIDELEVRLRIADSDGLFGEYLTSALPEDIYDLAGRELRMHPYQRILDETGEGASPGGVVIQHGYIPFASSIGGNLACYSVNDRTVRWADHSYVSTRLYTFHPETKKLEEHEITASNLARFLPVIAESFTDFIVKEKEGTLESLIEKLDLS